MVTVKLKVKLVINKRQAGSQIARVLMLVTVTTACAVPLPPPVRDNGLVFSDEGVHLAVVGQTCIPSKDPHPGKKDRDVSVETTLAIEVGNPTIYALAVHRSALLLIASDGSAVQTSTREAAENMVVENGATTTFTLQFRIPAVSCSQALRLEPNSAIELRGKPVNIGPVRFRQ
jgi:hypothetical protein